MSMRHREEIERILRGQKESAPSDRMVDMIDSLCLNIDELLGKQGQNKNQTLEAARQKNMTKQVNIAVDGPCGGGKTTLGAILEERYDCNLFHMDDFFLRAQQRSAKRYQEPGGNVDYERFRSEVLEHLPDGEGLEYRRFDCGTMSLGEKRRVPRKNLNIIEGSYSCHPYFGEEIYDLRLFVDISPDRQRERIIARSGEEMWKQFQAKWIPMENRYFDLLGIREKCIVIEMNL